MISLNSLPRLFGRQKAKKRVGRGQGSGKGSHTTGRGAKGQKVRGKVHLHFEGGQLPITKRLPQQKGFKGLASAHPRALKLSAFNVFDDGQAVDFPVLEERGLVKPKALVKVVRGGLLKKKLVFKGLRFTKGARAEALELGSTIE